MDPFLALHDHIQHIFDISIANALSHYQSPPSNTPGPRSNRENASSLQLQCLPALRALFEDLATLFGPRTSTELNYRRSRTGFSSPTEKSDQSTVDGKTFAGSKQSPRGKWCQQKGQGTVLKVAGSQSALRKPVDLWENTKQAVQEQLFSRSSNGAPSPTAALGIDHSNDSAAAIRINPQSEASSCKVSISDGLDSPQSVGTPQTVGSTLNGSTGEPTSKPDRSLARAPPLSNSHVHPRHILGKRSRAADFFTPEFTPEAKEIKHPPDAFSAEDIDFLIDEERSAAAAQADRGIANLNPQSPRLTGSPNSISRTPSPSALMARLKVAANANTVDRRERRVRRRDRELRYHATMKAPMMPMTGKLLV
ncbi:MAG: hypothetical protein Q9170_006645 [Blastenia crenularia]